MSKSKAHLLKKKIKPSKVQGKAVNQSTTFAVATMPDVPTKGKMTFTPPHEFWFVLSSGKEIRNLKELAQDLGDMEDFVFENHVNTQKNDFVNWVRDVFEDLELADKISKVKDKKKMQMVVYNYLLEKLW